MARIEGFAATWMMLPEQQRRERGHDVPDTARHGVLAGYIYYYIIFIF